jgi:hypothetical protein
MSAVRNTLSSQDLASISDATIGVVAILALSEAVDPGNSNLSSTHMAAAEYLVRLRGYENISWAWLERIVAADLKTATICCRRPQLPFPQNESIESIMKLDLLYWVHPQASTTLLVDKNQLISAETFSILSQLRRLSLFRRCSASNEQYSGYDGESIFKYGRLAVEHRLLEHIQSCAQSETPSLERSFQYALLLYVNIALWVNYENGCAILRVPAARLKSELSAFDVRLITDHLSKSKLLLWIHYIGAYTSSNRVDDVWYIKRLGILLQTLGITSCQNLRMVLWEFLQGGLIYGARLESIYKECKKCDLSFDSFDVVE